MSSHAATVSLGKTGSAGGDLKVAHVVGHLYVGGAGAWHFHRLTADEQERSVNFESRGYGSLWKEVAAAFAVLMRDDPGLGQLGTQVRGLGVPDGEVVRLDASLVPALARLVGDVNVAAALTVFDGQLPPEISQLDDVPGWSVQVAAPIFKRVHSRWGTSDTRRSGVQA